MAKIYSYQNQSSIQISILISYSEKMPILCTNNERNLTIILKNQSETSDHHGVTALKLKKIDLGSFLSLDNWGLEKKQQIVDHVISLKLQSIKTDLETIKPEQMKYVPYVLEQMITPICSKTKTLLAMIQVPMNA